VADRLFPAYLEKQSMNIIPANDTASSGSVPADVGPFRIAIMSTPRTGNTWLRRLFDAIYSLPQIVADTPDDVVWDQLPRDCILQLHWPADAELVALLRQHEFRIVTLFRNPCDTLISILHFATAWKKTSLWMGALEGDESDIVGVRPSSREFMKYAESNRAKVLIAASPNWAETDNCTVVNYESLVENTVGELTRVTGRLHSAFPEVVSAAVENNSLSHLRSLVQNQHFWRGQPGIWKMLLPQSVAQDIERHHAHAFDVMRYSIRDHDLSVSEADANWTTLELATLRQEMVESRGQLKQATDELNEARWKINALESELTMTTRRIAPLVEVSPMLLSMSTRINRVTRFCRGAAASIRHHSGLRERTGGNGCEVVDEESSIQRKTAG
jgi:hypothetical protein